MNTPDELYIMLAMSGTFAAVFHDSSNPSTVSVHATFTVTMPDPAVTDTKYGCAGSGSAGTPLTYT